MKRVLVIAACIIGFFCFQSFKQYNPFAPQYYNSSGKVAIPDGYHLSVWEDYVTPTSAYNNMVDYSAAHFVTTPVVEIAAEQSTSSVTNIPFASINTRSTTNCTVNILTSSQTTISSLGSVITGLTAATGLNTMKLHVIAIGYTRDDN